MPHAVNPRTGLLPGFDDEFRRDAYLAGMGLGEWHEHTEQEPAASDVLANVGHAVVCALCALGFVVGFVSQVQELVRRAAP